MSTLLYALFVLSGAAGLIYESIWSRYLGLFVGHSAYAQIIVLTIFLGGMSAGAAATARYSERLRDPLVAYAAVELLVGVIGFAFHPVFVGTTAFAYDTLFPRLVGHPGAALVAKWTLAALLILPQSVLLGATFPLMSAGVLRLIGERPGRVLSLLYFANSIGGAVGVLVAGFTLIRIAGLPGTLATAGVLNVVVAAGAFGVARTAALGARHRLVTETSNQPVPSAESRRFESRISMLLLGVGFTTAIASFIYEIAWIRMLSLVLGSATHSFELMLSAFILGLALGALWARARADRFRDPMRALGVVQWIMGLAALATIPVYLASFHWTASLLAALDRTEQGYALFTAARYAFCLAVMLPATFCAGITLPLITRTLLVRGEGERAIGAVYAANTLGSIVGVILAGLVLLPAVGLKALLIEGAVLDMALGVLLLRVSAGGSRRALRFAYAAGLGLAVAATASYRFDRFDRALLSSGVYRYGTLPVPGVRRIIFYADGRTATVSVGQSLLDGSRFISTNGKPDASVDTAWWHDSPSAPRRILGGDVSTQVLIPLITLAHAPRARAAAVIGEGSGMTSHLLLGSAALRSLVTIEIEPEMIAGSRLFYPANRRVFDDPRSRFVADDAKAYFAGAGRKFDIIISEPSNPWVSGVSGLFTDEFYARVRRYLAPHGVLGQWLHLYEINDGLVLSVLAALHRHFPSYDVFMTSNADILIVAGTDSTLPAPDWRVFDEPAIAHDLRPAIPLTPRQLESARLVSRRELAPILDRFATPNSDFAPLLDLGTERTRFLRSRAEGFESLRASRFDALAAYFGTPVPFDTVTRTALPGVPRVRELALGAAVRRWPASLADSSPGLDVAPALLRRWQLETALSSREPPPSWMLWVAAALDVERDIHGGTAGVADEWFYDRVRAYLAIHDAPTEARRAIAFRHALARWDFGTLSHLADTLAPAALTDTSWVDVDELREAGTIAKLKLGDVAGARALWRTLAVRAERSPADLRSLLIDAYLIDAARRE